MKSLPPALAAHLAGNVTTLATCWRVERADGALILGTEHDQDLTIAAGGSPGNAYAGTYVSRAGITGSNVRSTSDMSVDNLEVTGAVNQGDLTLVDLSAADIEAGLFDDATVTLFMVNWQEPDDGQIVLRTGTIGAISRTAEGQYRTELRGLAQRLTQNIVRTYGSSCDAELGDARCGVDLVPLTKTGTVTSVVSNREFVATVDSVSTEILLYLPMPADIEVGDTFTMRPGCDKSVVTCKTRFENVVNFRGHGVLVPGQGELGMFGGQTKELPEDSGGNKVTRLIQQFIEDHPELFPGLGVGSPSEPPLYAGGLVTWTSGANDTYRMEIKRAVTGSP